MSDMRRLLRLVLEHRSWLAAGALFGVIAAALTSNDDPPDCAVSRHSSPTTSAESVWNVWR